MKYHLISILFLIISCNGQKTVSEKNASNHTKSENPLVLVLQDVNSEFGIVETMVIKDQKRLKSFYSKINKTRKPGLPLPVVDFTKEMIIVHCSGKQSGSGMPTLKVSKETDTEIHLNSKIERDTKSSAVIRANPFCVYKMPLTTKKISIENSFE